MQYASATGLARMILIILLIYFGIKILSRLFAPFLMKFVAKKAEKHFDEAFKQGQQRQEEPRKEGEITIDKMPKSQRKSNDKVGDYVDYEELD